MIWSQWDAASSDSDFSVNFSEFCRVARLLYIRNTFDALPSYEFQKQKFKDEVDFLKDVLSDGGSRKGQLQPDLLDRFTVWNGTSATRG